MSAESGEAWALELAAYAVETAVRAGAVEAEATTAISDRFSAEARDATIVKLEQSVNRSLSLRVFLEGRKASLSTSDLTREGLRALVGAAVEAARYVAPDECAGLPAVPAPAPAGDNLGIYYADVAARDSGAKLADAQAMERVARAADARITNSNGSRVADAQTTLALVNSRGFSGSFRGTSVSRSSSPVAIDGESKRTASYGAAARGYEAIEAAEIVAGTAARRAVEMIGAVKPATMRAAVIFERDVAAGILADVFAAVSASNVATANSFLADRLGSKVGSDLVTIVDDGCLRGGIGTSPFDAEGVPAQHTVVFERGELRSFLFDTYYARKLGAVSTANASGGGIGPNNFHLAAGDRSLAELIAATERGVLVLDTIGFATEHVSGTYSRGARGFAISGGRLAGPIDGFTIAGNLRDMLAGIDLVANDLRFDGTIVAPSFRVAEMTISGT